MAYGGPAAPRRATPQELRGRSVGEAMVRAPKVLDPEARVADARALLRDDHVHAALVVDAAGRLLTVVLREDLAGRSDAEPLTSVGGLAGRTVTDDAGLEQTWRRMVSAGWRRLAVVDSGRGALLGLLCLKRSGLGFCSDADVAARGRDQRPGC